MVRPLTRSEGTGSLERQISRTRSRLSPSTSASTLSAAPSTCAWARDFPSCPYRLGAHPHGVTGGDDAAEQSRLRLDRAGDTECRVEVDAVTEPGLLDLRHHGTRIYRLDPTHRIQVCGEQVHHPFTHQLHTAPRGGEGQHRDALGARDHVAGGPGSKEDHSESDQRD